MRPQARYGATLLIAVVLALVVAASAGAKPVRAAVPISADPYSDPGAQHATEVEPDSFANGSTVVAAFQVGRRLAPGGASNNGWATSKDGGRTFSHGFLPGITKSAGGPYDLASDPSVAYDATHRVWLISSLAGVANPPPFLGKAMVVSRSSDGVHWSDPVTVASGSPQGGLDKNWTVCDDNPQSPFYGHCYTEFDSLFDGFRVQVSTSTDGGRSWGPAVPTQDDASGIGGQPVVQPDGTVIMPFRGPVDAPRNVIEATRSTDGGQSWSAAVTVSQTTSHAPSGMRAPLFHSVETDRAGNVYAVWQDCRFRAGCTANDIVLSRSSDGLDWSAPERIPSDPVDSGADHFVPGLAVDPHTAGAHARLALTYYQYPHADCTPATCELNVGFVSSLDGGATWSAPRRLAGPMHLDWLADSSGRGRFVGDYISTSFLHERAFPFFAVAHATSGGVFDEAINTVPGGLGVLGHDGSP